MNNTNRLAVAEYLKRDGRSRIDVATAVMFGDENAPALCEHGCEVVTDGKCRHGRPRSCRPFGLL
jgi:hypothetical protein